VTLQNLEFSTDDLLLPVRLTQPGFDLQALVLQAFPTHAPHPAKTAFHSFARFSTATMATP